MGDWRDETRADLEDAESRLVDLSTSISGELTSGQLTSLWRSYLDLEKSVVFIKLELDEENPGRFIGAKAYRVPDERQAVTFALAKLRKGRSSFEAGSLEYSLRDLREARNYLRVLLIDKRKLRAKSARAPPRS